MTRARELANLAGVSETALSNRNLIINGAMQVAQRGTSSTNAGYQTVDRFQSNYSQVSLTTSQQSLTSGDPYNDGFRKFVRVANTSVSSATDAYAQIQQIIEAQNIANSGWQYASSNSSVTLSFWARSSLAGTYYVQFRTVDSAEYIRNVAFTLVADTWKKISVTVAGNSNLVFNDDNGQGLNLLIIPHYGTTYTGGGEISTTDWYSRAGQTDAYLPDYAQNWANTASATFDMTGIQLEAGEQATPFEHRSYGDELAACQRYFQKNTGFAFSAYGTTSFYPEIVTYFSSSMRAAPTLTGPTFGGTGTVNITNISNRYITTDSFSSLYQPTSTGMVTVGQSGNPSNWTADAEL